MTWLQSELVSEFQDISTQCIIYFSCYIVETYTPERIQAANAVSITAA